MPGALGWVSISYEPLLVRALGAGVLLADGAARLRSVDVVRKHEHARQLRANPNPNPDPKPNPNPNP